MAASILIIDDSLFICEIICKVLEDFDCCIMRAQSGEEAMEILRSKQLPDLILLDIILPDANGYELCRSINQNSITANIPVIFITSYQDANSVVNGFEAGGADYISKPFSSQELRSRVRAHLTNKKLSDNMRVLNEELSRALLENRRHATEDPLTKLFNRRYAYETILRRFKKGNNEVSLLLADIDDFKAINDTYGHNAGDYVLCKIAAIIKKTTAQKGIACRWGGEEFLIALCGACAAEAEKTAFEICQSINDMTFYFKRSPLRCSITIGVVKGKKGISFESALANADTALYTGKQTGKNKCVVYI